MAQELSDKIRAAAQAKGIDPDIALRIARAESSLKPTAQAGTSSAGGLFQVVDKTWKEFGGKPGKKLDADENIRVGTDIIAKNAQTLKSFLNRDPRPAEIYAAHYFGPSGAKSFLSADPATPIVDILGKAAVKANPNLQGKNVGQVLAQLETKMGGKPANVSRETPEPAPSKALPASLPPMAAAGAATVAAAPMKQQVASLGPGYQAALALSFLADTDEKEDRDVEKEPGIAEQWLAQTATRPAVMAQFADLSIKSPFAEQEQPQMLADGGEVGRLTPQQIERLAEKNVKLTGINKVLDFVAQRVDPQTKGLPTSARTLLETVQGGRSRITEANFSPEEIDVMRQLATLKGGDKGSINYADYVALAGEMNKQGKMPASMSPGLLSMADPMGNVQTTLGQFRYQRDPKGNLQIIDTYDFNPPNPNATQEARTGDYGAFGIYGLIRDYAGERIPPGMGRDVRVNLPPVKRSDGGSAEPTAEELAAASRPATVNPNIRRQGEAARRLAAMRDVNTLPDPRTYAAVSGFLGTPPDEQGFSVMNPDREGIKRAGQAGFGVGTALQVAPVAGKAAQMLGKMTGSALNERMLAGQSLTPGFNTPAPINFAVKPKGGTFAYSGSDSSNADISKLDRLLLEYRATADDLRATDEVKDFLKAKAPKYFTTTYGTADDPLRTAIRERRVEPFGRDRSRMTPYMVDAAQNQQARGHLEAKTDLERAYDELTGIEGTILRPEGSDIRERSVRQTISEKMGQEGVPIEARNPPTVNIYSKQEFSEYPSSTRMLREFVENQEKLPPNVQQALNTGELMYDVSPNMMMLSPMNVVEALQQVPANKLKSMSFPEALVQGSAALAPVRDYRTAIDLAERGAKVPRQALNMFTAPVVEAPAVGGQWVQLTKPLATELEGKLMKHSVGGYGSGDTYGTGYTGLPYGGKKAFDEDLVRVYSLRNEQGLPEVTVEMAKTDAGAGKAWDVTQIRSRFNSEPAPQTREDIFNFLKKIDTTEGLARVKPNSYARSPTGDTIPGSEVDWGKEYDLWKQSAE
jgi:hypothetical protein